MAITVRIPPPLQKLTGGESVVESNGDSILELLGNLDGQFPGFSERVMTDGEIHRFVLVYVNGEDIREKNDVKTTIQDGDEVSIVPAIAGGSRDPRGRGHRVRQRVTGNG